MLTVPTTTKQYRLYLPPGRVGKVLLMDILGTIDARIGRDIYVPNLANRSFRLRLQLPTGPDLPIAA